MEENKIVQEEQVELSELLQIRRDKLTNLRNEGLDPFVQTKFERTANSQKIFDNFETLENQTVSVAGRIMSKREMGKASFVHIQDQEGRLQLYFKIDDIGEEAYDRFKKLDIGDIIGVKRIGF